MCARNPAQRIPDIAQWNRSGRSVSLKAVRMEVKRGTRESGVEFQAEGDAVERPDPGHNQIVQLFISCGEETLDIIGEFLQAVDAQLQTQAHVDHRLLVRRNVLQEFRPFGDQHVEGGCT